MPDFSALPTGRLDNVIAAPPGGVKPTGVIESSVSPNTIENIQSVEPFIWDANTFKLKIADFYPTGDDVFAWGDSELKLQGFIPWEGTETFVRQCMGYSWVQVAGGTYQLRRIPPLRHPKYQFAVATGVAVTPFSPTGENETNIIPGQNQGIVTVPVYRQAVATITFSYVPYKIYSDAELAARGLAEFERFTHLESRPSTEVLASGLDFMTFAAGPESPPIIGTPFQSGPSFVVNRNRLTLSWLQVPESWVFDEGKPTQIDRAMNTVNVTRIFGYEPGELLFSGVEFEKQLLPLVSETDSQPFLYTVRLTFDAFRPPAGVVTRYNTTTPPPGGTTTTLPPAAGFQLSPQNTTRKYWPTTSNGFTDGPRFYEYSEFRDIFMCCKSAPTWPPV